MSERLQRIDALLTLIEASSTQAGIRESAAAALRELALIRAAMEAS